MKVRIGISLGDRTPSGSELADTLGAMERVGFDSAWFPDLPHLPIVEPMAAIAAGAMVTDKLKFGPSVLVLTGRHPLRLAKSLVSVDRLSGGRLLPAFGLGVPGARVVDLPVAERVRHARDTLIAVRRLCNGETVTASTDQWSLEEASVGEGTPKPLDLWLGGRHRATLELLGELGDGWLPSFMTPEQVGWGIATIQEAAAGHGREVDPDHFGVSMGYAQGPVDEASLSARFARRNKVAPAELFPAGDEALRRRIVDYIAVGVSKFVLRPVEPPASWPDELERLAGVVLDLEETGERLAGVA